MKGGNIMAKGFELSLMVGASVAGALEGLQQKSVKVCLKCQKVQKN